MHRNQAGFSSDHDGVVSGCDPVGPAQVRAWFADPVAVQHYTRAAATLGLWRAEALVLGQVLRQEEPVLDVGCGAGRIAFGLWRLGYRMLWGIDFCEPLIAEARRLAASFGFGVSFAVADATQLDFPDGTFGGAVFAFNGLMQIPGRERRRSALQELRRVVRTGGRLVFTTHDRDLTTERRHWREEAARWTAGRPAGNLVEFGDRIMDRPEGRVFMHLPDRAEVLEDLRLTGWTHEFDELRSRLANELPEVREFSDECRFWVARA